MHIITLRRKLWLYRQIHKLNELDPSLIADGWNIAQMPECKHKYYEANDIWLKLLCLPSKSFVRVVRLAILLLIKNDKTLMISGKKLQGLNQLFTKNELALLKSNLFDMADSSFNFFVPDEFFQVHNVIEQASLALITRVYCANKHESLKERYRLRFNHKVNFDARVLAYINNFKLDILENALLLALKNIMPNLVNSTM